MNHQRIDQITSKVKEQPKDDTVLANSAVELAAELLNTSRRNAKARSWRG